MIFVADALVVKSGSESRVLVVEEVILADCNPKQTVALTLQRLQLLRHIVVGRQRAVDRREVESGREQSDISEILRIVESDK